MVVKGLYKLAMNDFRRQLDNPAGALRADHESLHSYQCSPSCKKTLKGVSCFPILSSAHFR